MNAGGQVTILAAVVALLFVVAGSAHLAAALTVGGMGTWLSAVGLIIAVIALIAATRTTRG